MSREPGRTEGGARELVQVAFTRDLAEAEMIRGLLEANGIVSMQKSVGVDGPLLGYHLSHPSDGQRLVVVRAEQAPEAEAVLAAAAAAGEGEAMPEIANAGHLANAQGGRLRAYYRPLLRYLGLYVVSIVAMAAILGAYLLYRSL